ncbi:amidohydrolase [Variovorax sp. 770b2]|uniref:amidohydrolase family protein n=1 Tax=Variovorax sp. 770b2 TaxID=1566271 RepID=UPI00210EC7D9|nr:amidohydrolase family protein [Variovorax sp. 770b2]
MTTTPAQWPQGMPAGACDTHMHVYSQAVAGAPGGPPLPGDYSVADYRAFQANMGLQRVVVVQPNAYQFDNSVLLLTLRAFGESARGVAVVNSDTDDARLETLTLAGVRAQRFYALRWGAMDFEAMDAVMRRVHPYGWHANIQLNGNALPLHEDQLRRLPGDFVIDHVGKFLPPPDTKSEAFRALLRLIDTGRCWVKLSAPYESSAQGASGYSDVGSLVATLAMYAPERMLWASNWPHPFPPGGEAPDDRALFSLFAQWVPDAVTRHRILVDNPAQLYGFAPAVS